MMGLSWENDMHALCEGKLETTRRKVSIYQHHRDVIIVVGKIDEKDPHATVTLRIALEDVGEFTRLIQQMNGRAGN